MADLAAIGYDATRVWTSRAFWILLILQLLPLWSFPLVASQDGPLHLYNALLARDYWRPGFTAVRSFFEPNYRIVPNWICPHLFPLLLRIMSPHLAEKLVLSGYLVLLPLAARYALRAIRPRAGNLAIAVIPMAPGYCFHMGFHDFCLSMVGYFIVLGYWLRRRHDPKPRHVVTLAGLLIVLYLTHLVGLVLASVALGWIALWDDLKRGSFKCEVARGAFAASPAIFQRMPRTLSVGLAILPNFVLAIVFLTHNAGPHLQFYSRTWAHRFVYVVTWMRSYHPHEYVLSALLLLMFLGVTGWLIVWHRGLTRSPGASQWLTLAAIYGLIFMVTPDLIGGGALLVIRLVPFPLFALLFWWAQQPLRKASFDAMIAGVSTVSAIVALSLAISHAISYRQVNRYLTEYAQAGAVLPWGATVLPIHWADNSGYTTTGDRITEGVDPFRHAAAPLLAERGAVNLQDEWASTGYHPLRFRQGLNPFVAPDIDGPDLIDFTNFSARTGRAVDYVILWTGGHEHQTRRDQEMLRQIAHDYRLIFTSTGSGYLRVYEKVGDKPSAKLAPAVSATMFEASAK